MPTRYYQRLLARDDDEAAEIVERYGQTHAPEDVYEDIMVPALTAAKRDRALRTMTPEDLQFVLQATRAIVEAVELRQSQAARPRPRHSRPPVRSPARARRRRCGSSAVRHAMRRMRSPS